MKTNLVKYLQNLNLTSWIIDPHIDGGHLKVTEIFSYNTTGLQSILLEQKQKLTVVVLVLSLSVFPKD